MPTGVKRLLTTQLVEYDYVSRAMRWFDLVQATSYYFSAFSAYGSLMMFVNMTRLQASKSD
jgi:hypothetical protein